MPTRRCLIGGLPLMLLASAARAETAAVQIYAAMTFRPALDAVLAAYRESGGAATAIYAPTPVLVRQLAGGAPADILLTADPMWMDEATKQSLIQADTRTNLLSNSLVLAGVADIPRVGEITRDFPLAKILGDSRLAMCDPANDPAGRYAKQSLVALGLWEAVAPHVAVAESAPGAVVMVDRGEVRAAICFKTDLHGNAGASLVGTFPAASHAPIVYPVALGKGAKGDTARQALAFLAGKRASEIFASFGYLPASG